MRGITNRVKHFEEYADNLSHSEVSRTLKQFHRTVLTLKVAAVIQNEGREGGTGMFFI